MVTGDNVRTAKAIALECGILDSDADATEPNLIEGTVFRALSDSEREKIADKISVQSATFVSSLIYLFLCICPLVRFLWRAR